ncbi:MAG TPA: hypothetical protein VMZ29_09420 [Candidatus Bathyarchaeia archaeon]|nr:hypothetical protein [Candidatus Bathyarchaeia archaeon]
MSFPDKTLSSLDLVRIIISKILNNGNSPTIIKAKPIISSTIMESWALTKSPIPAPSYTRNKTI